MSEIKRKFIHRYWEAKDDLWELHFIPYHNYSDEVILTFTENKEASGYYIYSSDFLNIEKAIIKTNSVEDTMKQLERVVIDHIEGIISYYQNMLDRFKEGTGQGCWFSSDVKPEIYKWIIVKDADGNEYDDHQWTGYNWYVFLENGTDQDGCIVYDGYPTDVENIVSWRYR